MAYEPDTDINKVVQLNRQFIPWPALVHKLDAAGKWHHKKVANEAEQSVQVKAGWFKTALEAETAALGAPLRTENDVPIDDDASEPEPESVIDEPNQTRGRRR